MNAFIEYVVTVYFILLSLAVEFILLLIAGALLAGFIRWSRRPDR